MSVAKHYTEWSKEDKDALASQRMEEMMRKNEEIKRRHAEVEADRKKAEQQNSSVTLSIKAKSPPIDGKFFDDSTTRESGYEDPRDVSRRNLYNSGSTDFRNSRQGAAPRRPYEKESDRGSHMSEKKRDDYEKWRAERKKIDAERIARHKVKREWDEHKVEQEPEHKPLPSSKFYREPSWSKQDDWPQRRDFNQRGQYRGNDRAHFKNLRNNYESEDANWQDKPNKSFGRSGTKDTSFDKFGRASLSDDEDNRCGNRQWKFDSSNSYSGVRRNQDGTNSQSFHGRGRSYFQGSRSDYNKANSTSLSNQNNSFSKNANSTDPNSVRSSRLYNSSDSSFDRRNNGQDTNCKGRFQGGGDIHAKPRGPKHSSNTWSDDESTGPKNATVAVQKSGSFITKQSSSNWSDDDDDRTYHKTNDYVHSVKHGGSFPKNGDTWSNEDTSCNANTALPKSKSEQNSGTWSDDDNYNNSKTSTTAHRNKSGGTWSDDDDNSLRNKPKDSSTVPQTKQTSGTWSDDDGTNVKRHSKSSSSTGSKDCVSSGGAWSDIDDESKSGNDNAWLDTSDKNEDSGSKYGKPRKLTVKRPPLNYPAGRGRKWSFEPSRQYSSESRSSSCNEHDDRKSENRAISLGAGDNLTVTISSASNDVKGNRPFSQWGARNSELHCKNTQVLSRSLSDPDKQQVIHEEPNRVKKYDHEHGYQQRSRNVRGRGNNLKRGNFRNSFEDASQQRFRDGSWGGARGGRGGFQHNSSFNRGARLYEETRTYAENPETQNRSSKSQRNEKPGEGWGDISKENSAVSVHAEDIWGNTKGSESANFSADSTTDNSGNKCLKSRGKTEDGWVTESYIGSSLQPNDDNWKSEPTTKSFTHNKIKDYKTSEGVEQKNPDSGRPHENISADTKRNIHEGPLHEHMVNVECSGNDDDSSWVTTSGDEFEEELGGGEYIDDDESLHISSVQHYDCGDDTSSPEPPLTNFVCSLTEFLAKTANAYNANDKMETKEVHRIEKSSVEENTFCSTPKLEKPEMTENTLLPEVTQLSSDNKSNEVVPVPKSELDSATENCPSTIGDGQKFLLDPIGKSDEVQLSATNHCKIAQSVDDNIKKTICEIQGSPEQLAVYSPTDESCKVLLSQESNLSQLELTQEKTDELEGQKMNSDHSENGDLLRCSETPCSSSVANNLSDFTSAENLHQNCISVNSPKSICNETTSSGDTECGNSSDVGESNEFQNSTMNNPDIETNSVCITDYVSCDNHDLTVMSPEENNSSEVMHNKQEDISESEISNCIISSSEVSVVDKTEVGNETDVSSSTANNEMPMLSGEDIGFSKNVPDEDIHATSDPTEKNV